MARGLSDGRSQPEVDRLWRESRHFSKEAYGPSLRLLRQDRKPSSASRTVHREMPPIEREDAGQIFAFGDSDQRRVGEVHRQVAVLLHQLAHAQRVAFVEQ